VWFGVTAVQAEALGPGALGGNRYRVIVSTDIGGGDEDDIQSMIHYLLYADLFDTEGLVSSPPQQGRKADILKVIDAYEKDYPRLRTRSDRYPTPEFLRSISKQGATAPAPAAGYDRPTEGSRWIIRCAHRKDPRPLYVLVWGAITDVAQALHEDPSIRDKLRVYFIASWNLRHDRNAFAYIEQHHKELWMIVCDTSVGAMPGTVAGRQRNTRTERDRVRVDPVGSRRCRPGAGGARRGGQLHHCRFGGLQLYRGVGWDILEALGRWVQQ